MKLTLRFLTEIGPRVGVLEVSDEITAKAILNSHLGQNGNPDDEFPCGMLVSEMPRLSMKDHLARWREAKALPKPVEVPAPNVTNIRRPRKP